MVGGVDLGKLCVRGREGEDGVLYVFFFGIYWESLGIF